MTRIRVVILTLLALFAISAVASASASAEFKRLWDVCEIGGGSGTKFDNHMCNSHLLTEQKWEWVVKESPTYKEKVVSSGGVFTLTAGGKKVECTAVTDKGTITGGKPGTDLTEEIKFTGCTANSKKCTAESGATKGTIIVTNVPTVLIETGGKLADEFKENTTTKEFVTIKFDEAWEPCPNFPTTKVKGDVAAEVVAGTGELNFPATPLTVPVHLEAFGVSATLVGKDTQELENGWAVTAI